MSQPTCTISPLRQRMIDDMTQRRLKPGTQRSHLFGVRKLASFLGRSPRTATAEDLRQFQLHMASSDLSAGSINCAIGGLRFFFGVSLDQPEVLRKISLVNEPRTLPILTVRVCSFTCSRVNADGTATRCYRPSCCNCCATGGATPRPATRCSRAAGCSRDKTR